MNDAAFEQAIVTLSERQEQILAGRRRRELPANEANEHLALGGLKPILEARRVRIQLELAFAPWVQGKAFPPSSVPPPSSPKAPNADHQAKAPEEAVEALTKDLLPQAPRPSFLSYVPRFTAWRSGASNRRLRCVEDERLSRLGRLIRLASIAELPQLWSALPGPDPGTVKPKEQAPRRLLEVEKLIKQRSPLDGPRRVVM